MSIEIVHTEAAPAAVGPYSQATVAGGMVFVSGQLGLVPSEGKLAEGFRAQAVQAMENLKAILDAAGSGIDKVLVVEVFLTDMARFKEFNEIYAEYFSEHKPARAAIEVAGLPLGGVVEVKCTALVK
ncbi:Rid family detoxifying hydrolase [Salidesulfovibrio brasiliensis]|uniref:Rid family detoxifying hydrolase n=1 Tax=Salidesulfovibrio brasiliensis TaxID=221711 RepID=UPI0006CFA2CE|nr:Rid family detoxifying hydrolase [Salidesulfovibrio brasiliensis]